MIAGRQEIFSCDKGLKYSNNDDESEMPRGWGKEAADLSLEIRQLTELLDGIAQPVFAVKDGAVSYCNRAAQALDVHENTQILALTDEAMYRADWTGSVNLPLSLPGGPAEAAVYPLDGWQIFVIQAKAEQPAPDMAFFAAQALRVPLSNLFGAAAALFPRLEELEDPAIQRSMASLNHAFYQLLRTTCNLTDLRAALDGEMKLNLEKTEMTSYIYGIFERTAPLCRTRGIRLECSIPPQTFSAWIDRQRLERAILNLLSNAIKFTPAGGTISVRLERGETSALIRVQDSGEGFAPSLIASAFTRYARAVELGDPRWGVGAGLPLARSIAQLHGGNLVVQSESDQGACVCLSISLRTPDVQARVFKSPVAAADYTGGYSHELTELADVLPLEVFDSINVN